MCFSLEMSTIMLIFGSLCTAIASKKLNNKIALWVGYFTIMQAIHIVGYLTINDCDNIYIPTETGFYKIIRKTYPR